MRRGRARPRDLLDRASTADPFHVEQPLPRLQPVPRPTRPVRAVRARSRRTPCRAPAAGSRWPTSARAPRAPGRRSTGRRPGRGDPRHRLRRAPLARRRRDQGRPARRRSRSATTTRSPTPSSHGDLVGQLDGVIDPLSGHGTFIAGLVHQPCPDADIAGLAGRAVRGPDRRVRPGRRALADRRAGLAPPRRARTAARRSTCSACRSATTTRRRRTQLFDATHVRDPRRPLAATAPSWSARPATTRPAARASRPPSRRGPTARARSRSTPTACRSSRWAPSTRTARDRRAVQQRRALGAHATRRAPRWSAPSRRSRAGCSRWPAPRRTGGCARPSTPTTSAAASGSGAVRRSPAPVVAGRIAAALLGRLDGDDSPAAAVARGVGRGGAGRGDRSTLMPC